VIRTVDYHTAGEPFRIVVGGVETPGGGTVRQDSHAEFASTAMRLNYPPFDPGRPRPAKEVRCFDGEPGCDVDGARC